MQDNELKLDGSKNELVSALEAEIRQLKEKLSLLDTQYNECSEQLTTCRQDPLVETMLSKVDRLEQHNEQLSRVLGECNGKLLALKTELDDLKHHHHHVAITITDVTMVVVGVNVTE